MQRKNTVYTIVSIIALVLALIVLSILSRAKQTGPVNVDDLGGLSRGYAHHNYAFEINYPADWQKSEDVPGVEAKIIPAEASFQEIDAPSVSISLRELLTEEDRAKGLEMYANDSLEQSKIVLRDVIVSSQTSTMLAGFDAYETVYRGTLSTFDLKILDMRMRVGDLMYTIAYLAPEKEYDRYLPVVREMLATIVAEEE